MSGTTMHFLRFNERARNFSAPNTFGDTRLAACDGKWLILFSRPADFTSVRTTEFMGLVKTDQAIL